MEAGTELDALIAEKVMIDDKADQQRYKYVNGHNKPYSTSMAYAWEIVEKFNNDGYAFCLESAIGGYNAVFDKHNNCFTSFIGGDSAPHAICLAALKVYGK